MASYTLTPNLGLRISSDFTVDEKYNLVRIDNLASRINISLSGSTVLSSSGDVEVLAHYGINSAHANGTIALEAGNLQAADTTSKVKINARNLEINTDDGTTDLVTKTISITGQPTIDFGMSPVENLPLADDNFWLGNISGVATPVSMSGDATMDNTGLVTLTSDSVETSNITNLSVTNSKIANLAVDDSKISGVNWSKIDKSSASLSDLPSRSHLVLSDIGTNNHAQIDAHIANTSNPHLVTKAQVLALGGPIVNDDVASNANIAYSKLNLSGSIIDSDVAIDANIEQYKILNLISDLAGKEPLVTKGNLIGNGIINVSGGTGSVIGAGTSLSITKSDSTHDGYLSASDWTLFNSKQAALTPGDIITNTNNVNISGGMGATVGPDVTIDIDTASALSDGLLSATDWVRFNAGGVATGNLSSSTPAVHITGGTGSVVGAGTSFTIDTASSSQPGLLSASDWSTFNGKQAALGFTPVPNTRTVNSKALSSDITLATSDLATDSTHRYVTDTQITAWNAKQDALGYTAENILNKGVAGGYVPLNGSTKIDVAYLPSAVMTYQSRWDPTTNTPALSDGTGVNGQVFWVASAHAGTVSGLADSSMINFQVGDLVVYSSAIGRYELTTPAAGVSSVDGQQGAVSLTKGNLSETTSSVLTITGGTNSVWGIGTTIQVTQADSTHSGYLSSTDWSTFNGKASAFTKGNLAESTSSVLTITGGSNAVIGSGTTIQVTKSDSTHDGYLSSSDWSTFNGKQPSGSYITALTGDVTGSGPGSTNTSISAATVTGKVLTGITAADGAPISTDTILSAFGKLSRVPLTDASNQSLVDTAATSIVGAVNLNIAADVDALTSGFVAWSGSGNYYSYVPSTGTFSVLRSGYGYVKSKRITWTGTETVTGLATSKTYFITYSATNTLVAVDSSTLLDTNLVTQANNITNFYINNVVLFTIWTDGSIARVVKENHSYGYNTLAYRDTDLRFGATFTGSGGLLSVLNASSRTIQSTGEDLLDDSGLYTRITDNPGNDIQAIAVFQNSSGKAQSLNRVRFTVAGVVVTPGTAAVYQDSNSNRYTVIYTTIAAGSGTISTWTSSGVSAPLSSGTLTRISGVGDATLTYSATTLPTDISSSYAPGGIPTSLTTSGATRYGIIAIYTSKDDLQTPSVGSPLPTYFQVLSTTAYSTTANAANSIGTGSIPDVSQFMIPNELKALELSLNGFVIVDGNGRVIPVVATNGFVAGVKTTKATVSSGSNSGSVTATTANNVSVASGSFVGVLSSQPADVQAALVAIDTGIAYRYIATLSWTGAGPYTQTISVVTHGRGLHPIVRVQEVVTGVANDVLIDIATDSSGNVTLTSSISFTGQAIFI